MPSEAPESGTDRLAVVFDMETSDPDDFLALLLLAGHPAVDLRAVTLVPGTPHQVGLVAWALAKFGLDIPVGGFDPARAVRAVSGWHYRAYGSIPPVSGAVDAPQLLSDICDEATTLISGAPLKNVGAAIRSDSSLTLGRLVVQGGFAGTGVVAEPDQLPKFRGRRTFPSYNLDGDRTSVTAVLAHNRIGTRRFVSKNVAHGVVYDAVMHARLADAARDHLSIQLIRQGMEVYLERRPEGKKLHDPLACCCAIDESVAGWTEVELYRDEEGWGARPRTGSRTFITTSYDPERFLAVLTS